MNEQLENDIAAAFPGSLTRQKTIPTFHPETSAEAADIFHRAGGYRQKIFISGFGNNIDPAGDRFTDLLVIKTDRLNSIITINARDFYLTVGAGYPLKEINQVLAAQGLYFPFADTNYPGSVGGAVAAGLTGVSGDHLIPLSRYILSVTAVLPDASTVTPGAETFKSVSGYDISRIFFNSWGVLGIVIQLSFRLVPMSKKTEIPHIILNNPDYDAFAGELDGDTPLARMCRKIKAAYDPLGLLPLL